MTKSLEALLTEARKHIEVTPEELAEARRRRGLLAMILKKEFPGSRVYVNGSIAHGDALTPLTDVDLGVVVPDPDDEYGPKKKGPSALQERAARALRSGLREEFPDLRVEWEGRKRSILVKFNDAVSVGADDFTADVIVAIDNLGAGGLFIPRFDCWDKAHPEEHTRLVKQAIEDTKVAYAHVNRLLKHWNRMHGKPLCSWNIKALALGCITEPMTQLDGLVAWFEHAIAELSVELTPDPAGVAEKPISVNEKLTRLQVVDVLRNGQKRLSEAVALEKAGYPVLAHDELARFFGDEEMLSLPDQAAVTAEEGRKFHEKVAGVGVGAGVATGTGLGAHRPRIPAESWGE